MLQMFISNISPLALMSGRGSPMFGRLDWRLNEGFGYSPRHLNNQKLQAEPKL